MNLPEPTLNLPNDDDILKILSEDVQLPILFPAVNDLLVAILDEKFADRQRVATVLASNGTGLKQSERAYVFNMLKSVLRTVTTSVR